MVVFWLIAGHFLTVLDAYVDRHLMGFDVSDDIFSFSESPPYVPLISVHVPLNKKKLYTFACISIERCKTLQNLKSN